MYLHAYGKSVIEIATNTIAFVTEFLPFVIKIHGGLAVGILPQLLVK